MTTVKYRELKIEFSETPTENRIITDMNKEPIPDHKVIEEVEAANNLIIVFVFMVYNSNDSWYI